MAFQRLELARIKNGVTIYLDTSAVRPLAAQWAFRDSVQHDSERERTRATRLESFFEGVAGSQAIVATSLLALEELAASMRNEVLREYLQARRFASLYEFRQADSSGAAFAVDEAQSQALRMLDYAVDAFNDSSITLLDFGCVGDEDVEFLRATHRKLLEDHHDLDSMDALHLAVAGAKGITHFVSFDGAWHDVDEVTVFG